MAAFAVLGHVYALAAASGHKEEQQDGEQGEGYVASCVIHC